MGKAKGVVKDGEKKKIKSWGQAVLLLLVDLSRASCGRGVLWMMNYLASPGGGAQISPCK